MGTVVQPYPGHFDEFASADCSGMPRYRDEVALTLHLYPEHAKAVVRVMECDAVYCAGQQFAAGPLRRRRVRRGLMHSMGHFGHRRTSIKRTAHTM